MLSQGSGANTVLDFARHYRTSVLPARPLHPYDKALAESALQIVESWMMARLRHQHFDSVYEVKQAMAPLLTAQRHARNPRGRTMNRCAPYSVLMPCSIVSLSSIRY